MEEDVRVSPYPIPELAEFLRPYRPHFYRVESLKTLERYMTGLLADIDYKSGAGIAEAVAGLSDSAVYRLMGETVWDNTGANRQRIGTMSEQAVAGDGMLLIDETGIPRKGSKTVGVAHQYCGELGKVANCQVVVTAHYVDPYWGWPALGRLYLPDDWCEDEERRQEAQIPADVTFQTKPEIALDLIDEAQAAGVPFQLIGADSVYGDNPTFLEGVEARKLDYVVVVACDFGVRQAVEDAEVADMVSSEGQFLGVQQRTDTVIGAQPEEAWQTITWREGQDGPLRKQFVAVRVWRSHSDEIGAEGWLMGERPLSGHTGDCKYYWSALPADTPLARLVELAHRRPSIERGYQDGKGETGLRDYPARLWHSLHRHLVIQFLTLSWLILQQPPPDDPEIVIDPVPVDAPEQVIFPLWA